MQNLNFWRSAMRSRKVNIRSDLLDAQETKRRWKAYQHHSCGIAFGKLFHRIGEAYDMFLALVVLT